MRKSVEKFLGAKQMPPTRRGRGLSKGSSRAPKGIYRVP